MSEHLSIDKVVKSVSITHKFDKPILSFLNTSDVENGKVISVNRLPIEELKGQAKKTIKKDDILFSEIRPKNRRFAYIDFDDTYDFVVSTKLMVLRNINPKVDNRYFYYFLTNDFMLSILQDRAENRIGSFPQITFDLLSEYTIRVPDLDEQKRIVSILSSLDSKIALNNRINAELEAMAKTIYDYWFVQFDFPFDFTQGKPSAEGKPYKSSGGKMVWNEELKREVPEGWEVGILADITNITTGKLDSNAEVLSGDYPFYTCAAEPTRTDTYAFDDTVILIAGNNASGNFHLNRYKGKFNAYQRTYIITAKELNDLEYIYQILNIETKLLKTQGKGSQTKFLTIGMLTGIKTIRNRSVMKLFHEKVSPMYEQQEILKKENQQLSSLRDWLLPMLMNGQVRVQPLASASGRTGSEGEQEMERLMAAESKVEYGKK